MRSSASSKWTLRSYQSTRRHITEDRNTGSMHHRKKFKCHNFQLLYKRFAPCYYDCLQVLGQWHLVEVISSLPSRSDMCAGIKLIRGNDLSWDDLIMVGQESPDKRSISYENHTIIIPDVVNSPSLWEQPGIMKYFNFNFKCAKLAKICTK
jgi:hypothetical protein